MPEIFGSTRTITPAGVGYHGINFGREIVHPYAARGPLLQVSGYYLRMRVVHLESGLHLYGGAQQVRYLLSGLAAEGIENVLICPRDSAISNTVGGMGGVAEVVEVSMRGDLDIALPGRLRSLLGSYRPNILHVHSRRGADNFGGWNARWAGVPAILTRRVESAEFKALALLKYQPYAAIIAISRAIEAQLKDNVGLAQQRIHYVASGVDTKRFQPAESRGRLAEIFGLPAGSLTIGVVAQLIPRKGHARLFGVLGALVAAHPEVQVLCFGRGSLERDLEQQVQDLDLATNVHLAGFRSDLETLLPELDLLAHPAAREGLGVAVLEALSCGVPVVTSAVGGLVDVVEHEVTGLTVRVGDDDALLGCLARLVTDPELRRRLGVAGRRRVEEAFSVESMTSGNLSVYRGVMKQNYGRN